MSRTSDYDGEMTEGVLTDEAIEAFFLGLPDAGWEDDDALAALATDVGSALSAPSPSPDHALLRLFWEGNRPAPSPAAASSPRSTRPAGVGPRASLLPPRRRLRLLATAAGLAAATLGVGVAGATGALPDPAQRVVSRVIEAISPFEIAEPGSSRSSRPSPGGEAETIEDRDQTAVVTGGPATTASPRMIPAPPSPPATEATGGVAGGALPPAAPGAGSTGRERAGETPAGESIPRHVPAPGPGPGLAAGTPAPAGGTPAGAAERAQETPATSATAAARPDPAASSAPAPPAPGEAGDRSVRPAPAASAASPPR